MKEILKVMGVLIIIMAVLTSVATTAYVIKIKISSEIVPSFGGYKPLVVLTGSMQPYIKPGDMVLVRNINMDDVKVEDIITYSFNENIYITHRVKEKLLKNGKVILKTQGDANDEEDNLEVYGDMVIGKVKFIIPKLGYIIQFSKSFKGFGLLVMVPVFILLLEQIYIKNSKGRGDKKRRYERHNNFHK